MTDRRVTTSTDGGDAAPRGPEIPWANDGSPVVVTASCATRPRSTITVVGMSVTLTTVGTSPTTVVLLKNGVAIVTVTVPTGASYAFTVLPAAVRLRARTDTYQVGIIAAGAGAAGVAGAIELAG